MAPAPVTAARIVGGVPDGILRPEVAILHDVWLDLDNDNSTEFYSEVATITWPIIAGKLYTLLYSPDMSEDSWLTLQQAPATAEGTRTAYFPIGTGLLEDLDEIGWDYWAGITGWKAVAGQNIELQTITLGTLGRQTFRWSVLISHIRGLPLAFLSGDLLRRNYPSVGERGI